MLGLIVCAMALGCSASGGWSRAGRSGDPTRRFVRDAVEAVLVPFVRIEVGRREVTSPCPPSFFLVTMNLVDLVRNFFVLISVLNLQMKAARPAGVGKVASV